MPKNDANATAAELQQRAREDFNGSRESREDFRQQHPDLIAAGDPDRTQAGDER